MSKHGMHRLLTVAASAWLAASAAAADDPNAGERLYFNHCAACHGAMGEGDGPVAAVMEATVPNLRTLAQRNRGSFPADAVRGYIDGREIEAAHGSRQMPVWGDVFSDAEPDVDELTIQERIAALVRFIETLQYR